MVFKLIYIYIYICVCVCVSVYYYLIKRNKINRIKKYIQRIYLCPQYTGINLLETITGFTILFLTLPFNVLFITHNYILMPEEIFHVFQLRYFSIGLNVETIKYFII